MMHYFDFFKCFQKRDKTGVADRLKLHCSLQGMIFNLEPDNVGMVIFGNDNVLLMFSWLMSNRTFGGCPGKSYRWKVPMAIELHFAVIYAGVKGCLNKMDPLKITKFENFLQHLKTSKKEMLAKITAEGKLNDDVYKELRKIIQEFLSYEA